MVHVKKIWQKIRQNQDVMFFLKYCILFFMLFSAIAAKALFLVFASGANPFLYANF